ncbi:MAG: hypothetical protein JNM94_00875 [Phycisphaerae bacterium]|nr:hypothetical protein [Phycisphaerae bacterium]
MPSATRPTVSRAFASFSLCVAAASAAQSPPPGNPPASPTDVPWPARIGLATVTCESARGVAPQVTLVPDVATYLDEISRWTPQARWPVLFDDLSFAPTFIRAFKPERVVRRASVGAAPSRETIVDALKALSENGRKGMTGAPCAVVTSPDDPAWVAAAALVAGRGAPIAFLDGDYGKPDDTLNAADFAKLDASLNLAVDSIGVPWRDLGDTLDAIALCRSLPAKAKPDVPDIQRPPIQPNDVVKLTDPCATTDALARKATGERSAIVGWIFGNEARCAYMAMSSLFAPRRDVRFVSGYESGEPWSAYDPTPAEAMMKAQGFSTQLHVGEQVTLRGWESMLMGGFTCDLLVMNSMGDPDRFLLWKGETAVVDDVPFLNRPTALHLIHSWSLNRPSDPATIGAAYLDRGVYAYVGSVQEPLLFAFVPPQALVSRWLGLGPFLVSGRMLDGPFDRVWRVTLIGDPICTILPTKGVEIPKAALPDAKGADVLEGAKTAMREFAASGDADKARAAMRDLVLVGADDVAAQFFTIAQARGAGAAVAADALGPLFRTRSFDSFVQAFELCRPPSPDAVDMLWHLATPRIGALDQERLELLRRNLRGPDVSRDLKRLLPGVDRVMGRRMSDRIVQDEMDKVKDRTTMSALSELLRR